MILCYYCPAYFHRLREYQAHVEKHHPGCSYNTGSCDICCARFTDATKLFYHEMKHIIDKGLIPIQAPMDSYNRYIQENPDFLSEPLNIDPTQVSRTRGEPVNKKWMMWNFYQRR